MRSEIWKTPLPYLALLLAHLIWGANYVAAKIVLTEVPPMSLGFLRFGLGCLLITPFLMTIEPRKKIIKLEHIPKLILGAVLIACINITFFYLGLARTSAINASILELTIPIISVLIGWWVLREKIFVVNVFGIILGLLGALTIIGLPILLFSDSAKIEFFGNFLLILGSISFVVGAVIMKKMLKIYPPLVITSFTFLVACLIFFIPAVVESYNNPSWIGSISILSMLGILYITVLSSICAYFLLLWGISRIDVSHANLFQYLEPIVAATLAVPLLGERISYSFIVGFCMIALGVYWGTLGREEHHHHHHKHHRI
jgi:drug/metabolite transporter (DMT)-like permease